MISVKQQHLAQFDIQGSAVRRAWVELRRPFQEGYGINPVYPSRLDT